MLKFILQDKLVNLKSRKGTKSNNVLRNIRVDLNPIIYKN